ncbi:hypothetical protein PM082_014864 [Marasmius tenuissimus]|nr:hypothetical protein PM082_014864 [Marasmius tenuissimus]
MSSKNNPRQKKPKVQNIRFLYVSAADAADGRKTVKQREKTALSIQQRASEIYVDRLALNKEQRVEIEKIHASAGAIEAYEFIIAGDQAETSQRDAAAMMGVHGLMFEDKNDLDCKWSIKWSAVSGKGENASTRVLFQW